EHAVVDDGVVAQHAYLRTALDQAFLDVAASNGSELGHPEHLPDLDQTDDALAPLRRQHAGQGRLHVVDNLVDDVVVADIDPEGFGNLARTRVGTHVETDDDRTRGLRQVHVGLGNAANATVDDVDPH